MARAAGASVEIVGRPGGRHAAPAPLLSRDRPRGGRRRPAGRGHRARPARPARSPGVDDHRGDARAARRPAVRRPPRLACGAQPPRAAQRDPARARAAQPCRGAARAPHEPCRRGGAARRQRAERHRPDADRPVRALRAARAARRRATRRTRRRRGSICSSRRGGSRRSPAPVCRSSGWAPSAGGSSSPASASPSRPRSNGAGGCPSDEFRAALRRAHVHITSARWEDFGQAQLEALADGALLATTPAGGPFEALALRPQARSAPRGYRRQRRGARPCDPRRVRRHRRRGGPLPARCHDLASSRSGRTRSRHAVAQQRAPGAARLTQRRSR